MHPLLIPAIELLQSELGKNLIHKGQKKIVEIAIPLAKKASQLTFNFLPSANEIESNGSNKTIHLSQPLDIVNNGLSLPLSYHENQFISISQKITEDLDIIKGQNEILFLSNSINYFIDSHKTRTGIDRGISYSLQYDIAAVCNYLKKHKELRFPGYLLHQFSSLSETLKELNIFYASILNNGHVPIFDEQDIKEELLRGFGIDKQKGNFGMYIPYEMKVKILRGGVSGIDNKHKEGSLISAFKDRILTKEVEYEVNDIAHDTLFTLKEELVSNEELEYQIVKMLKILPDKKLIVQSGQDT
jgi:hypothetical protein